MLTDLLYPPDTGNILCGTLNFAVLHVNFPGYPPDIKILPPPPGEVSAEPTAGGIPPRRTGEVPRFARRRGIRPARGKHKHFKRNNPRAYTPVIAAVPISNIRTRFCNTSGFHCILSFPPRPSYPVGAGRGYSRRETESPSGRTFSGYFSFRYEK